MSELWDVYDDHKQVTGKVIERDHRESLEDNEYNLVVCILIINADKDILIQKRSATKFGWPNVWADTGGAALVGETSEEAILRELYEELGIALQSDEIQLLISQKVRGNANYYRDVYVAHKEIDLAECVLDYEEVSDVKWVTYAEIEALMASDAFLTFPDSYIPYLKAYMESL
ncbi:MAG: NUDIX domain-containing protein [Vallitaleaceae bacterium]|jgi:8-oxo-dGTP pyrophosphatase MutT (NUDIX family)|nr:NUDIX domain-containing protein [Vallitaleaceae bacterium]